MSELSSTIAASHKQHFRAGAVAVAVLLLTSIHHAYGAYAFDTPWRLHIIAFAVPAAIAIVAMLFYAAVMFDRSTARLAAVLAAILILLFPVAAIGIYEGGYNHVFKNLVNFTSGEAVARALFPPPLYEMPQDFIFEATGIAQFPLSILAAVLTLPVLRGAG